MENVKILYVRNLMLHTTEDTLEQQFSAHTGKGTIERVKKIRDYAFIHFNTRENALKAMKAMNNSTIDNATIEVSGSFWVAQRLISKNILGCVSKTGRQG